MTSFINFPRKLWGNFFLIQSAILSVLLLFLFTTGCKKEVEPLLLEISPNLLSYNYHSSEIIRFTAKCSSGRVIKKFKITSREINSYSKIELDSNMNTLKAQIIFEFKAPNSMDTVNLVLNFMLQDEVNSRSTDIYLRILPNQTYLVETAGLEIFSHSSVNYDGYNFSINTPVHSEIVVYGTIHILDASNVSVHQSSLSRKWISPAGIKFVRFNDFDYANATKRGARDAYNIGIKNDYVANLNAGDVILTKIDNADDYIIIKLIYIIDTDSTNNDKYIFSIKR